VAVGETSAHREHQVTLQEDLVGEPLLGLDADDAGVERVVLGNGSLAHQSRADRHLEVLSQRQQLLAGLRDDDSAAGQDQRALGAEQHLHGVLDPTGRGGRAGDGQRLVELLEVLDLSPLHVHREVDQHGSRPSLARDLESLAEDPGELRGLLHLHSPLGHRLCDLHDVYRLEGFLVEHRLLSLAGDADDRDRIRQRRVEACDHVGASRPRGADGEADLAGGTGVAVGGVGGTLLVADGEVLDA